MKKTINIGIVAHVDAGKTTVSEHFLYHGGVLDSIGRVDHGNTNTDTLKVEQDRGITVKATTVSFMWNNVKVNLIDTPGHVDFVAEVERSMQVLDGAILVISAKEGIQAQTRVLYDSLRRLEIPTIIFINKLDRRIEPLEKLYREMQNQLDMNYVLMQKIEDDIELIPWEICTELVERNLERIIDSDIELLESYLKGEENSRNRIRNLILNYVKLGKMNPIYHGSALRGIGVVELLNGIVEFIENNTESQKLPLSAVVYKIDRSSKGVKQVYFRIFQGSIRLRENIRVKNNSSRLKVRTLKGIYEGEIERVEKLTSGEIGIFEGDNDLKIGDVIGVSCKYIKRLNIGKPTLKSKVIPVDKSRRREVIKAIYEMMEEDPLLQCEIDSHNGEISLCLFGEVQREILEYTIREKYNIKVELSETTVIFKERIKKRANKTIHLGGKLNPYRAGITLEIEPIEINTGLIYESKVSYGDLQKSYQRAVFEGVKRGLEGIYGWEVTDIKVTLVDMEYDSVTSTPADYRNLAPIVLREAIGEACTEILEPLNSFKLIVPNDALGRAVSDLKIMRGEISEMEYKHEEIILRGILPIETSRTYSTVVAGYTEGRGVFITEFYGYKKWKGNVVMRKGKVNNLLNRRNYLLKRIGNEL